MENIELSKYEHNDLESVARKADTGKLRWGARSGARRRGMPVSRRRSGAVILVVAFGLVMLSGFCAIAVDYGRAVLVKNQLQRACDAAALAGAQYLPSYRDAAEIAAVHSPTGANFLLQPSGSALSVTFIS